MILNSGVFTARIRLPSASALTGSEKTAPSWSGRAIRLSLFSGNGRSYGSGMGKCLWLSVISTSLGVRRGGNGYVCQADSLPLLTPLAEEVARELGGFPWRLR